MLENDPKLNLVFTGCGLVGSYYVGVTSLLQQLWPHKPFHKLTGASSGSLMAVFVSCGVSLEKILEIGLEMSELAIKAIKNPLSGLTMRQIIETTLQKQLPANAHLIVSGKFGVSVTRVWKFENEIVSRFDTRQQLIDAISASCFIPLWSGVSSPPKVNSHICIDGAYTNNKPMFELSEQEQIAGFRNVVLTPFESPQIEASPSYTGGSLLQFSLFDMTFYLNKSNSIRGYNAMVPSRTLDQLTYINSGFESMKQFVLKNNLVKCKQCYDIQESIYLSKKYDAHTSDDATKSKKKCIACLKFMEKVDSLKLPKSLVKACKLNVERVLE